MSEQPVERERSAVLPALEQALRKAALEQRDQGAVALARRYAQLLDDAVAADKYTKALRLVGEAVAEQADQMGIGQQTQAEQLLTAWDRIASALAEHSVTSDLGPKLQATLTALGMTPAGRAKGAGGELADVTTIVSPLQRLRDSAQQRNAGA